VGGSVVVVLRIQNRDLGEILVKINRVAKTDSLLNLIIVKRSWLYPDNRH